MAIIAAIVTVVAGITDFASTGVTLPGASSPFGATGTLPGRIYPDVAFPTPGAGNGDGGAAPGAGPVGTGIPATVLAAYHRAETDTAARTPTCHLPWSLVAGIGKVESDHARGGAVDSLGETTSPIVGPALDGAGGTAVVPDTDHGRLDLDPLWDRAVGPTQFLPATWAVYGTAVAHSGDPTVAQPAPTSAADINNVFDAAASTARYLCTDHRDVATPSGAHDAVFAYNHSEDYVARVLAWARAYAAGAASIPDDPSGTSAPAPSLATSLGTPPTPAGASGASPVLADPAPAGRGASPPSPASPGSSATVPTPALSAPHRSAAGPAPAPAGSASGPASGAAPDATAAASRGTATVPPPPPPPSATAPGGNSTSPSNPPAPPAAATVGGVGGCDAVVPSAVVASAFRIALSSIRIESTPAPGTMWSCTATGPGGPLVTAVATAYPNPNAASQDAAQTRVTAGRASLLVVNGSELIQLTVPATPATAGLTQAAATKILTAIRAGW